MFEAVHLHADRGNLQSVHKGYSFVGAVMLANKWFTFTSLSEASKKLGGRPISFVVIGWWAKRDKDLLWPTTHPDDLAKLYICLMMAKLEGKI